MFCASWPLRPIWTSDVRPGREHDTTALRVHTEILPALQQAAGDLRTIGDLGYEGESDTITVAFKKPQNGQLTDTNRCSTQLRSAFRIGGVYSWLRPLVIRERTRAMRMMAPLRAPIHWAGMPARVRTF